MAGQQHLLVAVAGPTAVGKTAVAIALAQHFRTEIISFDSRQCYREMNIGVARPSDEELAAVPHHFIASHSIHDPVDAAQYEQWALQKLGTLFQQYKVVIAVGGTGLYLKALTEGLDAMPDIPANIREQIREDYEANGMEWLQQTCPALNNGIAFCVGSFSARRDNNLVEMAKKYGHRFHFVHLRNTRVLNDGSFYESGHIDGGVNMTKLMEALINEMQKRKTTGRADFRIPMRPDHGIKIANDFGLNGNPGYPMIGRLKGLAEIAGLEEAILQLRK